MSSKSARRAWVNQRRAWIYPTEAQQRYVERLFLECQRHRCAPWPSLSSRLLRSQVSDVIDTLKTALATAKATEATRRRSAEQTA